ncbi:hypothetical protein M0804_010622 [Polistes exclamans]|nr:hypothetical protein M0804_010622 [Polistes exclamans]
MKNRMKLLSHLAKNDKETMSTADTVLSINVKMSPGPDHRQEPVAPDKSNTDNSRTEIGNDSATESTILGTPEALVVQSINLEATSNPRIDTISEPTNGQGTTPNSGSDNKKGKPTLLTLDDDGLRALLNEAITYKCPKDREGKSNLFKELLQEAEADETEEGRRVVTNSRCLPGSTRRRHKRDSVSERHRHGGSLQNLAQPIASEFDSSFAYLTSGSSHTYGSGKKKNKKYTGPSVSAREREGGSLPSNVNASHSLASLANLDLIFDNKKGFSEERTTYDWTNKEKSKSLDKSSSVSSKKEDKEKDKKDNKRDSVSGFYESESEQREKKSSKGKYGTNEMLESDNPPPEYKSDYTVIDLSYVEVGALSERNVGSTTSGVQQRPHSLDAEDEGIEMKIIEPRRQFIARATVDIAQTPVDTTIKFPICDHNSKQDKSKISVSAEVTGAFPFQTYNSAKCVIGGSGNSTNNNQGKGISSLCSMMPASWQIQNNALELPRCTTQYAIMKDATSSAEKKSLDENGNAVQNYNAERKKRGKKHTQEPNVIVYTAESVVGHRNEDDIDSLLNFIESKESKGKKNKTGNPVRVKSSSGTKPRTREKDSKREQLSPKLQKSNSLEEISKTKLEDLTAEQSNCSSGDSSISSQHSSTINVALRRAKQRSTGDAAVDCRGDRRSWGTEEGQSIYCNDTGDDYTSRRNSNKKVNPEPEQEPEFLIVTKKKKTKKQRRSSSGSRAQNLSTTGSYLQNPREFSNEYRAPLSPELRRKSTSSMPPSDKSDSSDLDSVHSLPVTSNTSKHNLSKTATSSGGTPQASYADIARMATMNMSHNSVLNMPIVPSMLNTSSWPRVSSKTPSEPDKLPQDYYPSLDELQHSDRKPKQHGFAHSNHVHNVGLTFEKPPSPTLSKIKNSSDRKKAEAQEEAINKNMQVFKYFQDIEKMQQSLTQQEQKHMNMINCNPHSNETTPNAIQSKLNNTTNNSFDSENNNPNYSNNNKDIVANTKINNPRNRRSYSQSNQNIQSQQEELHYRKTGYQDENVKKIHNTDSPVVYCETKANVIGSIIDDNEAPKLKGLNNNPKPTHEAQNADVDSVKIQMKVDKMVKIAKEQSGKSGVVLSHNTKQDNQEDNENKKSKSLMSTENDKVQKSVEIQGSKKKNSTSSRPAVILLDETSDFLKGSDLPTELTFGFEINELLLSEDSVETPPANPTFPSLVQPLLNKPPPNFDRPPAIYDKHVRYDKFPPNFHMQSPNTHVAQQPVHSVMVPSLTYIGYPTRFPPAMYSPPTPPPPPGIIEKYNHQPKEDFAMLYVAPEEDVNIQNYNHDKIVSFVGLAWDAVMRETAETGRIQYYSGQ